MTTASITVTAADQMSQKQVVDRWTARHAREIVGKTVRVSRVVRNGPFITYKLAIAHEERRPAVPAKSRKQFRYMKAVESGDVKGKGAPSKEVAREFTQGVKPSKLPEKSKKK